MSKPCWDEAPEWAMFLAQDKGGWWSWWNIEPVANESSECWDFKRGVEESYEYDDIHADEPPASDWTKSLEPRP